MTQELLCSIKSMAHLFLCLNVTTAKFSEQDVTNSLSATAIHFNATALSPALLYSSQCHSAISDRMINLEKFQILQNIYQILEHLESCEIIKTTIIVHNAFPTVHL